MSISDVYVQCHRPRAIKALFDQIPFTKPKRIALIGGGCSIASESTAEISHHFNVMQVASHIILFIRIPYLESGVEAKTIMNS